MTLFLLPSALAANDPGHDSLYVLLTGDSAVAGSINITGIINTSSLRFATILYGDYLDVRANGTLQTVSSRPAIQADASDLYLDSNGQVYISTRGGTSGRVQIGPTTGNSVTLNVSGTIRQQGVAVCLANGTNCISGNNTGNVSSVSAGAGLTNSGTASDLVLDVGAGDGISVAADSVAVDSTVCRSDGSNCPAGGNSSWNQTYADTLYYPKDTNPLAFYNSTTPTDITFIGNLTTGGRLISNGTAAPLLIRRLPAGSWTSQQSTMNILLSELDGATCDDGCGARTLLGVVNASGTTTFAAGFGAYWINSATGYRSAGLKFTVRANETDTNAATVAMTITNDTNVGIGTIAPTQKLDVNGSINVSGTSSDVFVNGQSVCLENGANCPAGATTPASGWFNSSTHVYLYNNATNVSIGYTSSVPTLYVDNANARVGVGTTSPSAKLHVVGNLNVSAPAGGTAFLVSASSTDFGEGARINLTSGAGGNPDAGDAGAGGGVTVTAGEGGLGGSGAGDGGAGGDIRLTAGAGGSGSPNGPGGSIYLTPGDGTSMDGNVSIDSGTLFVDGENDKVSVGTTTTTGTLSVYQNIESFVPVLNVSAGLAEAGSPGAQIILIGGSGRDNGFQAGGGGGHVTITAGNGGDGGTSYTAFDGANVNITGGDGGADSDSYNGTGGNIHLAPGLSTGAGASNGSVVVTRGDLEVRGSGSQLVIDGDVAGGGTDRPQLYLQGTVVGRPAITVNTVVNHTSTGTAAIHLSTYPILAENFGTLYGIISIMRMNQNINNVTNWHQLFLRTDMLQTYNGTISNLNNIRIATSTPVNGSITTHTGISIADLDDATNNRGIVLALSSGANKYNIYASGTATNYFAGSIGIGTAAPVKNLEIVGSTNTTDLYINQSGAPTLWGNSTCNVFSNPAGTGGFVLCN